MTDRYANVMKALKALDAAGGDVRMSPEMRSYIEGMSVSVDVSTGDHDAGHRYFGTVTEVMDCKGDKHGVTLLVQDAEPNFSQTPQTEPSDEEIEALALSCGINKSDEHWGSRYYTELGSNLFRFARALLARYGAQADVE